jgi:hypothetical protein
VLLPVERLGVFEVDLLGRPGRAVALVLPALQDPAVGDLILEAEQAVGLGEAHGGALLVVIEMVDQIVQRASHGGRADRHIAPHAEVAGLELVAEPEPEIVVLSGSRGFLEEAR